MTRKKLAIVLGGGGSRAAYQAGVLLAWEPIFKNKDAKIEIMSGVSAGSINAAKLTMHMDDLPLGVQKLADLWNTVTTDEIFESNFRGIVSNIFKLTRPIFPRVAMVSIDGV